METAKDTKHRPKGLSDRPQKARVRAQAPTPSKSKMIFLNVIKKRREKALTQEVLPAAAAKAVAQRVRGRMSTESITTKLVTRLTRSDERFKTSRMFTCIKVLLK